MFQIKVWEDVAENLDEEEKPWFWADKMAFVGEQLNGSTRIGHMSHLLDLLEVVCEKYNTTKIKRKNR
jgi:hypothetical protein